MKTNFSSESGTQLADFWKAAFEAVKKENEKLKEQLKAKQNEN